MYSNISRILYYIYLLNFDSCRISIFSNIVPDLVLGVGKMVSVRGPGWTSSVRCWRKVSEGGIETDAGGHINSD